MCLAGSGGFAPISFPLFQGVRFGGSRIEISFSIVVLLGVTEGRHPSIFNVRALGVAGRSTNPQDHKARLINAVPYADTLNMPFA